MEGDAQLWYQLLKQEAVYISWNEFKEWLHLRYGPNKFLDFFGELTKLQKSRSVEEYQSKFEKLLAKVEHLPQACQVRCFISGLCESIRIDVQTNRPDNLTSAIGLARLYEAREFSRRKSSIAVKRGSQSRSVAPTSLPRVPMKKMTIEELNEPKKKGLASNAIKNSALAIVAKCCS